MCTSPCRRHRERHRRSRILGSCASMMKNEVMDELQKIILKQRGSATAVVEPVVSPGLATDATFADVWQRYRTLKASSWSNATRKAVVSVFETAPPKGTTSQAAATERA